MKDKKKTTRKKRDWPPRVYNSDDTTRDTAGRFGPGNHYGGGPQPGAGRPEKYTEEWVEKELNAFSEWVKDPMNIWPGRFAAERGYLLKRLYEAVEKYPSFSDYLETIKERLHGTWVEGATFKRMSEGMAKCFLRQWKALEPEETTVHVKNSNPLAQAVLESMDTSRDIVNDPKRSSKRVSDESSLEDRESLQDN